METVRRRLALVLLRITLDADEAVGAFEDLDELRGIRTARGGAVLAELYFWSQLAKYPLYLASGNEADSGSLGRWARELRFGARRIMRRPGSAVVIVLTLALGIGSSATVFTVFDAMMFQALPLGDPDRLVRVRETVERPGQPPRVVVASANNFHAWQERGRYFSDLSAARYRTFSISGDGEPERVVGVRTTANFFDVHGVGPIMGRTYNPDEDQAGAPALVAVISTSMWNRRFGGDPTVLGREIVLNGRPHTVIGVMPAKFRYPYAAELWIPLGLDPTGPEYTRRALNVTARLADGATREDAAADLTVLAGELAAERPDTNRGVDFVLIGIREEILQGMDQKVVVGQFE